VLAKKDPGFTRKDPSFCEIRYENPRERKKYLREKKKGGGTQFDKYLPSPRKVRKAGKRKNYQKGGKGEGEKKNRNGRGFSA